MTQTSINISGVVAESITDGPGIRYTIFAQGCPHACPGCHNPETWEFVEKERMTVDDLFADIQKNPLVKGVTFSGGEPLSQAEAFASLAEMLQAKGYEIAVYTGYTFEEMQKANRDDWNALLKNINILIDGRFEETLKDLTLQFRGSKNQRILNMPASLHAGKAVYETHPRWTGETE